METVSSWTIRDNKKQTPASILMNETPLVADLPSELETQNGSFSVRYQKLAGGKADGMYSLLITHGDNTVCILPDRGMGLWKCWSGDLECGWQSPVAGPVHPMWVPIQDSSGIGWLEGFDELLVRCGLLSNGAPEFTDKGTVRYPLHGRIANLPAHQLSVHVDYEQDTLDIVGVVTEARFLIYSLELQTRYRFRIDSPIIEIVDTVTNRSGVTGSMQMLYHINIGQPILQSGSQLHTAHRSITPRDARAKVGNESWYHCEGPTSGYAEQVYYVVPMSNGQQWTEAMLTTPDEASGFSVQFDTRTLPYLNLWKNTVSVDDGYVVGLEPATGYPNTRSMETQGGRVIALAPGESKSFRLRLNPLNSASAVEAAKQRINEIQTTPGSLIEKPFN